MLLLFVCLSVSRGSLSRSVSAGATGLTVDPKEQTSVDMNGPVVPEKLLKNIQVRQSLSKERSVCQCQKVHSASVDLGVQT